MTERPCRYEAERSPLMSDEQLRVWHDIAADGHGLTFNAATTEALVDEIINLRSISSAARQRADALEAALTTIDRKLDVARLGLDRNGPQHARITEAREMIRAALVGPGEGEEQA